MASTYLQRTPTTRTNNQKFTYSCWFKRSELGTSQYFVINLESGNDRGYVAFDTDNKMFIFDKAGGTDRFQATSNFVLRDTSAWYHLVYSVDSTAGSNRVKIYINGVDKYSDFTVATAMSQNSTVGFQQGTVSNSFKVGSQEAGNTTFNGLMSYINFVDGLQLDASAFGETDSTTGEWKILTSPTVSEYGNNGFFILKNGNSLTDQSGKGNNLTLGAGTLTKTEDSPSNVFATWNPLQATTSASYAFEAGNTRMSVNDAAVFSLGATLAATTGKYYMEMKWVQQGGNGSWGMIPIDTDINNRPRNAGVGWNQGDNAPWLLGSIVSGSWGGSIGTSDIIQLAMDLDNGAFYFGKNGTYLNSGNPTSGSSRTGAVNFSGTSLFGEQLTFAIGKGASGTDGWNANFGNGYIEQTPVSSAGTNASGNGIFEYDVPSGYTALSTKGLNL